MKSTSGIWKLRQRSHIDLRCVIVSPSPGSPRHMQMEEVKTRCRPDALVHGCWAGRCHSGKGRSDALVLWIAFAKTGESCSAMTSWRRHKQGQTRTPTWQSRTLCIGVGACAGRARCIQWGTVLQKTQALPNAGAAGTINDKREHESAYERLPMVLVVSVSKRVASASYSDIAAKACQLNVSFDE